MDYEKIIDESMKKLNKNLLSIYNEAVDNNLDHLENCKTKINEKYENFIQSKDVQKIVSNYLTNIYDNKKEEALKIMKDVVIDDNELEGY
jgi:ribosomal protein S17E